MSELLITGSVGLLLILFALLIGWRPLRQVLARRRRERLISGYGLARLDNVMLDDGMGGQRREFSMTWKGEGNDKGGVILGLD